MIASPGTVKVSIKVLNDGHYEMDYEDIQKKMQENNVKLLIYDCCFQLLA